MKFAKRIGFEGFSSSPRISYESLRDRNEVELLQGLAIAALESDHPLLDSERWGGENVVYDTAEWLELAEPVNVPVPASFLDGETFGWGITFISLTATGAELISDFASERGIQNMIVDPSKWLEWGLDRGSVEIDRTLLLAALHSDAPFTTEQRARAAEMLSTWERWLAQAKSAALPSSLDDR